MAHQVVNTIDEILKYEKEKIIRPSYGPASLLDFEKEYDSMLKRFEFLKQYSTFVDNATNDQLNSNLTNFKNHVSSLVNSDETNFVSSKAQTMRQLISIFNATKQYFPQYACAAMEDMGLLSNLNLQKEYKEASEGLKVSTTEALKRIEEQSSEILRQASAKAEEIENSARKTAQKISVVEAQTQFTDASKHHLNQSYVWGSILIGLILVFICFVLYLLNVSLPDTWSWQILYFTAIRLSILTLISTLLGLSIKMLKSHLHLREHNLHRRRIANSMTAFVESASSKEQRDLILSQLVSSVSAFGDTGIISSNSDVAPKISVDNITKTIEKAA